MKDLEIQENKQQFEEVLSSLSRYDLNKLIHVLQAYRRRHSRGTPIYLTRQELENLIKLGEH